MSADWTIAVDDLLVGWQPCTLCGATVGAGRCDIWVQGDTAAAFTLCNRCLSQDGAARVRTLFERRYGR